MQVRVTAGRGQLDGDGPTRFVPDGAYRIAVHYYADNEEISQWPTSTSNATIRVFVFGLLRAEFNHPLSTEGDVWVVGDVVFPGPTVEPNGTVLPSQMCGVF